jgi:HPt (histidine-containing phosphotransfer) domain-containing protein
MTSALECPLPDASAIRDGAWNTGTFDELMTLIGARAANTLAARFRSDLRNRFANVANREQLRRDAHAVASTSEVLGLLQLSRAARSLEAACETDEAIESSLRALRTAKVNATRALIRWTPTENAMCFRSA